MTTAEQYRDLIAALGYAFRSFRSAHPGHERRSEAMLVRRAMDELAAAFGPRLRDRDIERAERLMNDARATLEEFDRECRAADANLTRMAFAAEWK